MKSKNTSSFVANMRIENVMIRSFDWNLNELVLVNTRVEWIINKILNVM